eukprot:CAMPEP_0202695966 /NCGR_PEP_ID=MMETSP1385-20130828/9382_1 /ASSEMBLY_ACC=CAM_ASM_000861 /TAXON_ID=933848 /ORGANISM="Elphidium margaritaceum" /LENGTH=138 /DNA_ID=CAMNT_0049352055 /DNA_START=24 /DNA_END=440 /DNA_ORIENTATION=-
MASISLDDAQENAVGVVKGLKEQNTNKILTGTAAALLNSSAEASTLIANVSICAVTAGLGCAFSRERGELNVGGRRIWFKKSTTFQHFKYRHYCKMRDIVTGIEGRADGRKSKNGAVKDALHSILQNLNNAGHIRLVQ